MNHRAALLLLIAMLSSGEIIAQAGHDGDWWRGLSPGAKETVITGFLDGMALGQNLALMGAGNSSDSECRSKIEQSYTYVRNRYFQNVGPGEIVSALDELYSVSDNSTIIIGRAVWIAVTRLGGAKPEDVQKLIQQSRGMSY